MRRRLLLFLSLLACWPAVLHAQSVTIRSSAGTEIFTGTTPGRVDPTGTTPQPASQSGTWTIRALGNIGGVLDATGQNAASPANWFSIGCTFYTAPTTLTNGNGSPIPCTAARALVVDGSAVTQPVSGTVTTTPPANASTNVAQFGGTNVSTGTGAGGAGIPRVTVSNDSSLAAHQSVNVDQVNGNTIAVSNGASGTGNARVNIANDNTGIANWGQAPTGLAPPSGATQAGFVTGDATLGGHLKAPIYCDSYVFDRSTTADVQLVSLTASEAIYICGYKITGESATTSDVNLRYDTNANCTTSPTSLTPPTTIGTGAAMIPGYVIPPGLWSGLKTPASDNLCVHRSAVQTSEVEVWYTKF